MRRDKRATRNRVYSLVGGGLAVGVMLAALKTLERVGERKISESVYAWPHRTLAALCEAEERFRARDLDHDGVHDYATTLAALERAGCITTELAAGEVRGYRYLLVGGRDEFTISAAPVAPVDTSCLWYWADRTHVVRARAGAPAGKDSPTFWDPLLGEVWGGPAPMPAAERPQ